MRSVKLSQLSDAERTGILRRSAVPDDNVRPALAEKGLGKPVVAIKMAEVDDPVPVPGQRVVVKHKTGKVVLFTEYL